MLDQNTDRSWWMIGSIIVGAILIGSAKVFFPELFDMVIDFAKGLIPDGLTPPK